MISNKKMFEKIQRELGDLIYKIKSLDSYNVFDDVVKEVKKLRNKGLDDRNIYDKIIYNDKIGNKLIEEVLNIADEEVVEIAADIDYNGYQENNVDELIREQTSYKNFILGFEEESYAFDAMMDIFKHKIQELIEGGLRWPEIQI